MKRKHSHLSRPIRILIYAAFPLLVIPILFSCYCTAWTEPRRASCLSNLKQIGTASMMYLQDWDNYLPSAHTWMNNLWPYMKNDVCFRCPELMHNLKETEVGYRISAAVPWPKDKNDHSSYGYAFNSALSQKLQTKIPAPENTPLVFDSDLSVRNAASLPTLLPDPPRHDGGNNFTYADGHAKWQVQTRK